MSRGEKRKKRKEKRKKEVMNFKLWVWRKPNQEVRISSIAGRFGIDVFLWSFRFARKWYYIKKKRQIQIEHEACGESMSTINRKQWVLQGKLSKDYEMAHVLRIQRWRVVTIDCRKIDSVLQAMLGNFICRLLAVYCENNTQISKSQVFLSRL